MLDPILGAFEKLVIEFSWRRLLYITLITAGLGGGFVAFEWYTGFFSLTRIDQAAAILVQLDQIDTQSEDVDPEILMLQEHLLDDLSKVLQPRELPQLERIFPEAPAHSRSQWVISFLAGSAIWLLVAMVGVANAIREGPAAWAAVVMLLLFAALWGWIGTLIPPLAWPWVNVLVYPALQLSVIIMIALILAARNAPARQQGHGM